MNERPARLVRRLARGLFVLAVAVVILFVLSIGAAVLTADVY